MAGGDDLTVQGTRPRLITAAEAAGILRVSEQDVLGWMAAGLISHETLSGDERRVRLVDESHERSSGRTTSMIVLELQRGISDDKVAIFEQQLQQRRREYELQGLHWTGIDAQVFAARLAARLAQVVPEDVSVTCEAGMLWVAGSGVDFARLLSDDEQDLEARLVMAAGDMLGKASEAISEITAEPWPAKTGCFAGGFPPYQAEIANGELLMSYGNATDPILRLAPLKLDEVMPPKG